jgi:hypothetical protein
MLDWLIDMAGIIWDMKVKRWRDVETGQFITFEGGIREIIKDWVKNGIVEIFEEK